jgi:dTDP-6-deoxy-L-talose 4-dehydrogenase (NAD+)
MISYAQPPDVVVDVSWSNLNNYKSNKHYKNFKTQKIFLKNLIDHGLKNLIVTGTCLEYGKKSGALKENLESKPIVPYAKAKLQLLQFLKKYQEKQNFKLSWLRLFYIYGTNKRKLNLYELIKKYENGGIKKLSVSGFLKRDYLSIEKVCLKIKKIITLNKNIGIINICSGKSILLKSFVYKILKRKNKFKFINFQKKINNNYEPKNFWGDTKKFNKLKYR